MHATGTRVFQRRRFTSGTVVATHELESETLGARTFEGNETVGVHWNFASTTGSVTSRHEYTTYERYDGLEFRVFGQEYFLPATATTPSQSGKITYTPAYLAANAALAPGEAYRQTYTQTSVRTDLQPTPPPASFTVTETNTFVGLETVVVPAGTFAGACKWQRNSGITYWLAPGSGILLKTATTSPVSEEVLEFATRDGAPVTP